MLTLSTFVLSVVKLGEHWNYEQTLVDVSEQIKLKVTPADISSKIQQSIDNSEFDDAKNYLQIAKEHHLDIDFKSLENQLKQKDKALQRIAKNATDFAEGFIKGESASVAGVVGAVSADFTVVGDVRDLRTHYIKHQQNKDINELVVVLSGAGVGLTALTVGSLGAAAPAKSGVSVMKLAVKSQRLSKGFQKQLLKHGRKIFDWSAFIKIAKQDKSIASVQRAAKLAYKPKAIKPLQTIAARVNGIRKASSTSDTLFLLKYVDNSNDLLHLEKVAIKHGAKTKGLFKLLGKGVIRTSRVLLKTTEFILSMISTLLSGLLSVFLMFSRKS